MDKELTKKMIANTSVKTAEYVCIDIDTKEVEDICNKIKIPCVVKPCSAGSSAGVTIVQTREELEQAISLAKKYEDRILIEDYIEGREFSVGVLNGKSLPPIEIIPKEGFYDYKNKYQPGLTEEICPAELSEEETRLLGNLSLEAFSELGLKDYARIDFMYDGKDFYCLEANTLPGMTPTSLLPQEAAAIRNVI